MAMELKVLKGNTCLIPGPVNIGVLVKDRECLLVDTGLDRQAGKQILRCLEREGLTPKVIVNTHSHADHYGGNAVIKERTGAAVFTSSLEKTVIENPSLEPFCLFSAAPIKELTIPFLMAEPCTVEGVLVPGSFSAYGFDLEIIALSGHSPGQIGVVTPDGVCFAADAYFGLEILDKYGMTYCADIGSALKSFNFLRESNYNLYVPCHGQVSADPSVLLAKNEAVIEGALSQILDILHSEGRTREELLAAVMLQNGRELNAVQYVLNFSTISACLSYLHNMGQVEYSFREGKMIWAGR